MAGSSIGDIDMDLATFTRLRPLFTKAAKIILNGIGEPLMNSALEQMLSYARKHAPMDATISFQTNGCLLNRERLQPLLDAGLSEICISLDSLNEKGADNHGGLNLDKVEEALTALNEERTRHNGHRFRVGVETVLSRENIQELPDLISWAIGHGADFSIVSHLLPYDAGTEERSLFNPNSDRATNIFNRWSAKAAEKNIDLYRFYHQLWKCARSDKKSPATGIIDAMLLEARESNTWINIGSLLDWQRRDQTAIHRLFQETRTIADEAGFELFLPPLNAPDTHTCRFIEEQSVFISSEGLVAPCHHLWHDTTTYLSGERLNSPARYFGSVLDEDPVNIWNKPQFLALRHDIQNTVFPTCRSCALGPCPDITGNISAFKNDCFGNSTPCGSCLWSQGGIRCL